MLTALNISKKLYQKEDKNFEIWPLNIRAVSVIFVGMRAVKTHWSFIIWILIKKNLGFLKKD